MLKFKLFFIVIFFADMIEAAQASAKELEAIEAAVSSGGTAEKQRRNEQFHEAVIEGDLDKVSKLISEGVNVNTRDKYGQTALHWAINNSAKENVEGAPEISPMVELLLKQPKINVNIQDENGFTPLMLAINSKNLALVQELINIKADVNFGRNFRARANYANQLAELFRKSLLEGNLEPGFAAKAITAFNKLGFTPLMDAIKLNNFDMVKLLVDSGANVDAGYINPKGLENMERQSLVEKPIDDLLNPELGGALQMLLNRKRAENQRKKDEFEAAIRELKKHIGKNPWAYGPGTENYEMASKILGGEAKLQLTIAEAENAIRPNNTQLLEIFNRIPISELINFISFRNRINYNFKNDEDLRTLLLSDAALARDVVEHFAKRLRENKNIRYYNLYTR